VIDVRGRHDFSSRSGVRAELVGDHEPRLASQFAQQTTEQAFGRLRVSVNLDDLVENIAVLMNGAP